VEEQKYSTITAYILAGSLIDLSILDFSCVNVRLLNLDGTELADISAQFEPLHGSYNSLESIIRKDAKRIQDIHTPIHVLLPIDFSQTVTETTLQQCIHVLKLLFPSDLELHTVATFYLFEDRKIEWQHSASYNFHTSGADRYDNYFSYPIKEEIDQINKFITHFFGRINKGGLFSVGLDAYLASFGPIPIHMSFISLCMSMETITDGTSELLYRMRRSMALLCAENSLHAKQIYDNVKLIYEIRSNIVHGGNIDYNLLANFHPYLRSLISRMLIKLVSLDLNTATELQDTLLFLGFTDRNKELNLEKPRINLFTYSDSMKALSKKPVKTVNKPTII
jgi:hypothetical protein